MDITLSQAKSLIETQFPQLRPLHLTFLGKGWDNVVFEVNTQYVFRFPCHEKAVRVLQQEALILKQLQDQVPALPLKTPQPVFSGQANGEYPYAFVGYTRVSGQTVCQRSIPFGMRRGWVEPLATFLRLLHPLPLIAERVETPLHLTLIVDYHRALLRHEKGLRAQGLLPEFVCERIHAFEPAALQVPEPLVTVHGDLYARHLIVDAQNALTGCIDWGGVHRGHRAMDLSIAYSALSAEDRDLFFASYGEVSDTVRELSEFLALCCTLNLLTYALAVHDDPLKREMLAVLQHLE